MIKNAELKGGQKNNPSFVSVCGGGGGGGRKICPSEPQYTIDAFF